MLQKLLTQFHLSKDSILVSNDEHAGFLKKLFYKHLPPDSAYAAMARKTIEAVFARGDGQPRTIRLSSALIRETYAGLLENVLGVDMPEPLADAIRSLNRDRTGGVAPRGTYVRGRAASARVFCRSAQCSP